MVKITLGLCLLLSLSFNAFSEVQKPTESGFSGDILIGAVYLNNSSLMSAGEKNQVLTSFNDKAESDQRVLPGLLGNAYYTFDSLVDQLYVGVSRTKVTEGQLSPELGYRRLLQGRSSFTLAYIPSLLGTDTYSDPFVLNDKRDETDQNLSAVRAKWKSIVNSGISVELAYGELDIDKEQSGAYLELSTMDKELLKRSARYGYASVELQLPIANGIFISPSIYGIDRAAEGDAYSYKAAGIELGLFAVTGRHRYSANVRVANYSYESSNPVFNKQRDERKLSAFIGYFYQNPFGLEDTTFTIIANHQDVAGNIDFYETASLTVATGLNWNF